MRSEAVGVLGGTFDPVHVGHLHVAQGVRRVFRLPRVLLVPCATPSHKSPVEISPSEHRIAMLRLAIAGETGLEVSTLEVDRGGTSFTIDTLRTLRNGGRSAPVFIVGLDALADLPTWREHRRLVEEFDLVAVDRPGGSLEEALRSLGSGITRRIVHVPSEPGTPALAALPPPGEGGRIFHLVLPPIPVSSREIRALSAAGAPLASLVPPAVARYIQTQGLYRQEGSL